MVDPSERRELVEDKTVPSQPIIVLREAAEKNRGNLDSYRDQDFATAETRDLEYKDAIDDNVK
jgi:hypothetical protein